MNTTIAAKLNLKLTKYMYRNTFTNATWIFEFPELVEGRQVLISESDSEGNATPGHYLIVLMPAPNESPKRIAKLHVTQEALLGTDTSALLRSMLGNLTAPGAE